MVSTPFQHRVFNALGLEKLTEDELHELFLGLTASDDGGGGEGESTKRLHKREVAVRFHRVLKDIATPEVIDSFVDEFWDYETEPLRERAAAVGTAIGGASAEVVTPPGGRCWLVVLGFRWQARRGLRRASFLFFTSNIILLCGGLYGELYERLYNKVLSCGPAA